MAISAKQIRAARGLLNWLQPDLSKASGVGISTIRKFEKKEIQHRSSYAFEIRKTFEDAGLEFIEPDGVRYSDKLITYFECADSCDRIFEDILQTVRDKGGEVVFEFRSSSLMSAMCSNKRDDFARLNRIAESAPIKCIVAEVEHISAPLSSMQLRVMSKLYLAPISFVVYGNKLGMICVTPEGTLAFRVCSWAGFAADHREHFQLHWVNATPAFASTQQVMKTRQTTRTLVGKGVIETSGSLPVSV